MSSPRPWRYDDAGISREYDVDAVDPDNPYLHLLDDVPTDDEYRDDRKRRIVSEPPAFLTTTGQVGHRAGFHHAGEQRFDARPGERRRT
jgi:hypothetical protein